MGYLDRLLVLIVLFICYWNLECEGKNGITGDGWPMGTGDGIMVAGLGIAGLKGRGNKWGCM